MGLLMISQLAPDAGVETADLMPRCDVFPESFALRLVTVVIECLLCSLSRNLVFI